jgi:hypothetical protein
VGVREARRAARALGEPLWYRLPTMQLLDGIALTMLVAAAIAFGVGASSLARAEDLKALYWLVVGIVAVRGAVQIARPRGA